MDRGRGVGRGVGMHRGVGRGMGMGKVLNNKHGSLINALIVHGHPEDYQRPGAVMVIYSDNTKQAVTVCGPGTGGIRWQELRKGSGHPKIELELGKTLPDTSLSSSLCVLTERQWALP